MKRYGNIWPLICEEKNVRLATYDVMTTTLSKMKKRKEMFENRVSRKGLDPVKNVYHYRICEKEAIYIKEHFEEYIKWVQKQLVDETYEFGNMIAATVFEPKKRQIDYPEHLADRVYHHCLINVVGPLFIEKMTADTYGSLKGRGLTQIATKIQRALREHPDWYFVQTDFRHYYENNNHDILKKDIRRVFKDIKLIRMLDMVIDHFNPGLAIGVFPSSYLANLYAASLDHLLKEKHRVAYVFRYMDDIVCIVPDKPSAKKILEVIREWGKEQGLEVKKNARIAPVTYGIKTCGYEFYPTHTRLRKSIKVEMKKSIKKWKYSDDATFKLKLASHYGWCKHGNCRHLVRKAFGDKYYIFAKNMEYKRLSDIKAKDNWFGLPKESRVSVKSLFGQEIVIFEFLNVVIKGEDKIAVRYAPISNDADQHYFITKSAVIADRLSQVKDELPFIATLSEEKNYYKID